MTDTFHMTQGSRTGSDGATGDRSGARVLAGCASAARIAADACGTAARRTSKGIAAAWTAPATKAARAAAGRAALAAGLAAARRAREAARVAARRLKSATGTAAASIAGQPAPGADGMLRALPAPEVVSHGADRAEVVRGEAVETAGPGSATADEVAGDTGTAGTPVADTADSAAEQATVEAERTDTAARSESAGITDPEPVESETEADAEIIDREPDRTAAEETEVDRGETEELTPEVATPSTADDAHSPEPGTAPLAATDLDAGIPASDSPEDDRATQAPDAGHTDTQDLDAEHTDTQARDAEPVDATADPDAIEEPAVVRDDEHTAGWVIPVTGPVTGTADTASSRPGIMTADVADAGPTGSAAGTDASPARPSRFARALDWCPVTGFLLFSAVGLWTTVYFMFIF